MEGAFKTFFTLAVLVFCMVVIGIFLIIIKVVLLFQPDVHFMGLLMTMAN
ncbi:MAG: hypothetical protein WCN88_01520 [Candidatus Falkowbacteria bacterium]